MRMGIQDRSGVNRSLLFALTGILLFGSWVATPSFEMAPSVERWLSVLSFSATLLSLAVALPVFGRMVGEPPVDRVAIIAGAAAGLCSVANIFEDGFQIDWFFFVFVLGLLAMEVALLALAVVIVRRAPGRYRVLALIPAGTLLGLLLFRVAGGPIMLVTWLAAAVAALQMPSPQTPVPAAPTTT